MRPKPSWIEHWRAHEDPAREEQLARELLAVFMEFWEASGLDGKSKTTKVRYSGALHSLGGYLVEKAVFDDENLHLTATQLLDAYVGPHEGPLIRQDHETWQDEIDMVCRKLHRFRSTER